MKTIIIVGAGVTGLSTAYHLARLKAGRIIVLEQGPIGNGSSSRAGGITCALLWTETGVRARKVATKWFRHLSGELSGYTYHNEHGCLNLFSPELWPTRAALLPLYDRLDAPYQILSAEQIKARWPQLNPPENYLGLHDPLGGYSEPTDYLPALAKRVREFGVEIREQVTVRELLRSGNRITGVRTDAECLSADTVVVASYAWILPLLATAGLRIPAKTFIHQRFVSSPLPGAAAFPPVNADPYLGYIRPAAGNRLLLGIETPDVPDLKVSSFDYRMETLAEPWELVAPAVERFADFFPGIQQLKWESAKVGLLSFSLDGEPIIGPMPGVEGLLVGCCFHSGGFSYNPAVGLFLAEYVTNGAPSIDLSAFLPARFASDETAEYLATSITQGQSFKRRH
ncbi:MAG: FAD-binding oxidoreductase [Cephaloticoccus sp.]|nr:FAD-binding oxidoreductase [Cephaloticoccus sp.]MCF7761196.1 FAD-binding oxidoreductase [Cephaloticoccus sp.]